MSNLLQTFNPDADGKLTGTFRIHLEKHVVIFFINRVTDKKLIKNFSKSYGADEVVKPRHIIKKFGIKIEAGIDGVKVYRNEDFSISEGQQRWVFNLLKSNDKVPVLYAVHLEVIKSEPVSAVEFTAHQQVEAAFAVYREHVAKAELELKQELARIATQGIQAAAKERKPIYRDRSPSRPVTIEEPKPKTKKLLKRSKT